MITTEKRLRQCNSTSALRINQKSSEGYIDPVFRERYGLPWLPNNAAPYSSVHCSKLQGRPCCTSESPGRPHHRETEKSIGNQLEIMRKTGIIKSRKSVEITWISGIQLEITGFYSSYVITVRVAQGDPKRLGGREWSARRSCSIWDATSAWARSGRSRSARITIGTLRYKKSYKPSIQQV